MGFSNSDIQNMGSIDLSETKELDLAAGDGQGIWEQIENLRLKKEGRYWYWKLRGGIESIQDAGSKILRVYGFESRADSPEQIKDYLALHTDSGKVKIYDIASSEVIETITSFSTSQPVQFYSSGKLLYVFDGDRSKYIDLSSGAVSPYMNLDSTPIKSYEGQTAEDAGTIFQVKDGDRALAIPPDISDFGKEQIYYGLESVEGKPTSSRNDTDEEYNGDYIGEWYTLVTTFHANKIYAYKPEVSYNTPSHFVDNITYDQVDSDGYIYFRVANNVKVELDIPDSESSDKTEVHLPHFRKVSEYDLQGLAGVDFTKIEYATISYTNSNLVGFIDNGFSEVISYTEGVMADTLYKYVDINDSILDLAEQRMYDMESTVISDTAIEYFSFRGNFGLAGEGKYYRQYVCVDVLSDGSVCIPGKPILVERDPESDNIGVRLDVNSQNSNVTKRYLCATRYRKNKDTVFKPSSVTFDNSPLFIVKEVGLESNELFDFSNNEALIRPITEIMPMSAGVPAIFGSQQIIPQSICGFESTIAIGGYTINRPTPTIYSSFLDHGNLYLDQEGVSTIKTATIFFEYSDGTYSEKATADLQGDKNMLTIHSLNSLISAVHVYIKDGTNEYKLDSYQPTDAEFGGMPFELPTDLYGLTQKAIPDNLEVVESVNLSNYVTVPLPMQNAQIASQAKTFGSDSIVGMVPLDYDPDRNPLRYRLQVFTTDNIQTGYITEVQDGSIISYNASFEITTSARKAKTRDSINRVDRSVFFQDEQGINVISSNGINLLINSDEYITAKDNLTDVVFNEPDGEIWFLFDSNKVLVLDTRSSTIRTFRFSKTMTAGSYHNNQLYVSSGNNLCRGEQGSSDLGDTITGNAITQYLGDNSNYTELNEVHVFGNGSQVTVDIDDQPQRERYADSFSGFEFAGQKSIGPKPVSASGVIFMPRKRGIKLRIGFLFSEPTTTIENIVVKLAQTKRSM